MSIRNHAIGHPPADGIRKTCAAITPARHLRGKIAATRAGRPPRAPTGMIAFGAQAPSCVPAPQADTLARRDQIVLHHPVLFSRTLAVQRVGERARGGLARLRTVPSGDASVQSHAALGLAVLRVAMRGWLAGQAPSLPATTSHVLAGAREFFIQPGPPAKEEPPNPPTLVSPLPWPGAAPGQDGVPVVLAEKQRISLTCTNAGPVSASLTTTGPALAQVVAYPLEISPLLPEPPLAGCAPGLHQGVQGLVQSAGRR